RRAEARGSTSTSSPAAAPSRSALACRDPTTASAAPSASPARTASAPRTRPDRLAAFVGGHDRGRVHPRGVQRVDARLPVVVAGGARVPPGPGRLRVVEDRLPAGARVAPVGGVGPTGDDDVAAVKLGLAG